MKSAWIAFLLLFVATAALVAQDKKADPPKSGAAAPTISDTQKNELIRLETVQLRIDNQIAQLQGQLAQAQLQSQQNGSALDKAITDACATPDKKWTLDIDTVECVPAKDAVAASSGKK